MRAARSVVTMCCVLLVALGCSGTDDGDLSAGATTTAPAASSTSSATSTPSSTGSPGVVNVTWTGRGFADLEWGADRATTIAALTELLGPPSSLDQPDECGQYASWRDRDLVARFLTAAFSEDGRFGTLSWSLADFPHASGVGAGDRIVELQAAEADGTWDFIPADADEPTGQQVWSLHVGEVVTRGFATGLPPDGRLEPYVSQHSAVHQAPPCGD